MSHLIHENRCVFARGIPAWHKLGKVEEADGLTFDEAFQKGGLDYTVEKVPSFYKTTELVMSEHDPELEEVEKYVEAEDFFLTVADWGDKQTVLGQVGKQYTVLQNREAFSVFDPLIHEGEAVIDAAGVLNGGRTIWALARIPDLTFEMFNPKDRTDIYLLITNSHDGSSAVRVAVTPIRVVCWNTLSWSLGRGGNYQNISIKHTASVKERVEEAHKVMGITRKGVTKFTESCHKMEETKLTTEQRAKFVASVLGIDLEAGISKTKANTLEKVAGFLHNDPFATDGTVWQAYNAITAYADHGMPRKGGDEGQIKRAWFGSGAQLKQRAFTKAMQLV